MFADLDDFDQGALHSGPEGDSATPGRLTDAECACDYCLAGKATLTLRSAKTGARFTYRVKQIKDAPTKWFVSLLSGPDNTADYVYLGLLVNNYGQGYRLNLTAKSKMRDDSAPVVAFRYFAKEVLCQGRMPKSLEVFHEGRCGRCNRLLTVPESVERGIGPECFNRLG
jgi:hypothetical protein